MSIDLKSAYVSYFEQAVPSSTPAKTISLQEFLDDIRDGAYRQQIEKARKILGERGKDTYRDFKKTGIPAVTPSGTCERRSKPTMQHHTGVCIADVDDLDGVDADSVRDQLCGDPHVVFAFVSPSGDGVKAGVMIPTPGGHEQHETCWRAVREYFRLHYGLALDETGKDVSRLCFVSHDPDVYLNPDAEPLDVEQYASPSTAKASEPTRKHADFTGADSYPERFFQRLLDRVRTAQKGTRHHTRLRVGEMVAGMVAGGLLPDSAESQLLAVASDHSENPADAAKTIHDALAHGRLRPLGLDDLFHYQRQANGFHADRPTPNMYAGDHGRRAATTDGLKRFRDVVVEGTSWSDLNDARLFIREHQRDLHYVHAWKQWLYYDKGVWIPDESEHVACLAKDFADNMVRCAKEWKKEIQDILDGEGELPKDIEDQTTMSEAFTKRAAKLPTHQIFKRLELARSEPNIPIKIDQLNQHPMLLACRNGVVDLTTGELLPHRREYLLTNSLDVDFDPEATCPRWIRFIHEIMGGAIGPDSPEDSEATLQQRAQADERARELSAYLQRVLGLCLTGSTKEQVLFIFYGGGSNGKSVLIGIVLRLLAALGKKATADLFMSKNQQSHPTELADLFGKRFVAATELEEGKRLSEALVKECTGEDPISARHMHQDFWTFLPTHKVVLATNHKPIVRDTSHGMWRRIQAVPFTVTFYDRDKPGDWPEGIEDDPHAAWQDKDLTKSLMGELPGIFAWMVQGCRQWQEKGLCPPQEVLMATSEYRASQDVLAKFIEECCVVGGSYQAKPRELWSTFKAWCEDANERALTQRQFVERLMDKGFSQSRTSSLRAWEGIGITTENFGADNDKR